MEYTNSQIREAIDELIHSERDRAMLKRRFIDGVHLEPLAEEYDLSVQRVKAIVAQAKKRIFRQ